MLYILDHYYALNHEEYCLVLESEEKTEDVIGITSALAFLLEDMLNPAVSLEMDCLKKILVTYYGMKDVKDSFDETLLKQLELPVNTVTEDKQLHIGNNVMKATAIDLYEARESCCGPNYTELIQKYIPKEKKSEIEKIIVNEGIEV